MPGRRQATVLDVRLITFSAEIDQIGIELNNINFAELQLCLICPIWIFEYYVAIKPCNILYILRDGFNCNIEEPLFLPEQGTPRDLYQNVCILVSKFKLVVKRELYSYERNAKIGTEDPVVR